MASCGPERRFRFFAILDIAALSPTMVGQPFLEAHYIGFLTKVSHANNVFIMQVLNHCWLLPVCSRQCAGFRLWIMVTNSWKPFLLLVFWPEELYWSKRLVSSPKRFKKLSISLRSTEKSSPKKEEFTPLPESITIEYRFCFKGDHLQWSSYDLKLAGAYRFFLFNVKLKWFPFLI
jgi:hypothetical protein